MQALRNWRRFNFWRWGRQCCRWWRRRLRSIRGTWFCRPRSRLIFSGFRRLARFSYGVGLTDATYAIHIGRFASGPPRRAEIFTTNILAHSVWVGGTAIGVTVGQAISDLARYGIDFAISAMFIALVVPLIQSRRDLAVALTAAAASGIFIMAGFAHWTVLAATAVAMIMAWGMSRWTKA